MTDAFEPSPADLSGIDGVRDLYVGLAIHKAVTSVDEIGTSAAAATGVTGVTLVLDPPAPTSLVVDHPFLFFIRHNPTGAILFQGRVADPRR
jgi:serine protease inhibitor